LNPKISGARRIYVGLSVACAVFAIYGSLLPFDFHRVTLHDAWDQFQATLRLMPRRISRSDVLANILLFVPTGFALAGSLLVGRRGGLTIIAATLAILPVSLAISLLAEFLQTFALARVPSNVDIASQTVGSLIGIGVWIVAGARLTTWVREASKARAEDRWSRLLTGLAAAWVFVNLAPFDFTLDVGDLAARVRSGAIRMVPFAASDVPLGRRLWDFLAGTISATPLGVVGVVGWNARVRRAPAAAFAFGAALVVLVEFAQVFVAYHVADVTDIIAGCLGVALGVWIAVRFVSHGELAGTAPRPGSISLPAATLFIVWCMVLCAYHWLPYDFGVDGAIIRGKLASLSLLPFAGYRGGSDLNAFTDLLTKLALSMPLGVIAAFVVRRGRVAAGVLAAGWVLLAACIFGVIEAGQLFLPSRFPDVTDVLVGMAGTAMGLALGWWVRPGHQR
jgi:VanZ family protein